MKRMLFVCSLIVMLSVSAVAQKGRYTVVEVSPFDIKEGVDLPANYAASLPGELVNELVKLKKFKQVLQQGETVTDSGVPSMRITGNIVEFKEGSRAKRYLVGFGAGQTKLVAEIKFIDRKTNEVVFAASVNGQVTKGAFGGDSLGAAQGLAKEIAKVAKKQFF